MTPTAKLRFVERNGFAQQIDERTWVTRKVHILQQWWEDRIVTIGISVETSGEWRDVPVEVMEAKG